jgi:NADH dehydrogenase
MRHKRITIFGGSGFIGRYLVKRLCSDGWEVRVAVRDYEAGQFLKPLGDVGQVVIWQADIVNLDQVMSAIDSADAVVNLVGVLFESKHYSFNRVHNNGIQNIAEASKAFDVKKLIHVSALGASENSSSKYSQSKAKGEKFVSEIFQKVTILRPSVIFGPDDGFFNMFAGLARYLPFLPVFGCPVLPKVSLNSKTGISIDFYGAGGTKFQPVYVGDVADAIIKCLNLKGTSGKTYDLGGPVIYSFKELMELMLSVINRNRVLVPIPFMVARVEAFFLQMFPNPILTCDQVELLKYDNIVSNDANQFKQLGIKPKSAELILPEYLSRFARPSGR